MPDTIRTRALFLAIFVATLVPVAMLVDSARAADSNLDAASSTIVATFTQEGAAVKAPFTQFNGSIVYQPDNVAASSAMIEVVTGSLDLGDETYNEEVRRPEWFDSANHPNATFHSTVIESAGNGAFKATGELCIKGIKKTVTVPITVAKADGVQSFDGTFEVSRKAFSIGEPMWDEVLEDTVVVRFHLLSSHQ